MIIEKRKKLLLISILLVITTLLAFQKNAFAEEEEDLTETVTQPKQTADAIYTEYEVLDDGGYTVNMYHSLQGPLCDQAFVLAQGNKWLVTDYFNISINNNLRIYEIASYVRLKVKIPRDLVKKGRTWWMIAISRNGMPYYFDDEDEDDTTITFSTNRFYAYAMCYTDEPQEKKKAEEPVKEEDASPRSRMHTITDSKTISGKAKDEYTALSAENPELQVFYGTKVNRIPRIKSRLSEALKRAWDEQEEGIQPYTFSF